MKFNEKIKAIHLRNLGKSYSEIRKQVSVSKGTLSLWLKDIELMLYWAEGAKRGEQINFSNSDPRMIKFMMLWFRKICKVPEEKFRIKLYIHSLHCRKDMEKYWSELTNIPLNQFQKTHIKPTSLGYRKHPLYNGTCAVRIGNKDLFRKIKGWRLGLLDKFKV